MFSITMPNTRSNAQALRRQFAAHLEESAVEAASISGDLAMAVGEALANAAEHGFRPGGSITLTVQVFIRELIVIEVIDDGHGFAPRPHDVARDTQTTRGFGIHIMRSVMDDVDFQDDGRRVVLKRSLAP